MDEFTYLTASPAPAQAAPKLEPALRVAGFDEVVGGLGAVGAAAEARRCFFCGTCVGCEWCATYCPEGIMGKDPDGTSFRTDPDYCKGCAACAAVCVRGVLTMGEER